MARPCAVVGLGQTAYRRQLDVSLEGLVREAALRALEDELADPAAWADPARSAASSERHAGAKRRVEELLGRWEAVAG